MHMKNILPASFRPILWSYRFDAIDPEKDKRTIIVNTINYGNLDHWKWIAATYGKSEVRKILGSIPSSEIRPRVRRLASIIFSIDQFSDAPRSSRR